MPNDDAAETPNSDHQLFYEIIESASDPNRQWQLIARDAIGNEYCRIGFKTYGDAWRAAERRKSDEYAGQADLLAWVAHQHVSHPDEYKADILTWSERQASLLRLIAAGEKVSDQIDWENIIDEVESAGLRQLTEAKSLLIQALSARLKAWAWPRSPEVARWQTEAFEFQREAVEILSPAMRRRIDINKFYFKAIRCLPKTINGEDPELFPTECPLTLEDLLGD
jgi:hypothetical protein